MKEITTTLGTNNMYTTGAHMLMKDNSSEYIANKIYNILEKNNWAPRLAASPESIKGRLDIFPEGQLMATSHCNDEYVGNLSINRVNWDGEKGSLLSWDDIAGDPTTYENTYDASGNCLVFMSMNINRNYKGQNIPRLLIDCAKRLANALGVEHIVGSFRPSEFGEYKLANEPHKKFEEYTKLKNKDGYPIDLRLRSLTKNGMIPLKIDENAMTVACSIEEFEDYKNSYKTNSWKQIDINIWECGEVGNREIHGDTAIYKEKNLRGKIPFKFC